MTATRDRALHPASPVDSIWLDGPGMSGLYTSRHFVAKRRLYTGSYVHYFHTGMIQMILLIFSVHLSPLHVVAGYDFYDCTSMGSVF